VGPKTKFISTRVRQAARSQRFRHDITPLTTSLKNQKSQTQRGSVISEDLISFQIWSFGYVSQSLRFPDLSHCVWKLPSLEFLYSGHGKDTLVRVCVCGAAVAQSVERLDYGL
jgi:hypothetical protein